MLAGFELSSFWLGESWIWGHAVESSPPSRSAVLVRQTVAAVWSSGRKAVKSVSSVICAVVQWSPASIALLPHASTTSGKVFNHSGTDLISCPM